MGSPLYRNGRRGAWGAWVSPSPAHLFFSFHPGELCPVTYRAVVRKMKSEKSRSEKL